MDRPNHWTEWANFEATGFGDEKGWIWYSLWANVKLEVYDGCSSRIQP